MRTLAATLLFVSFAVFAQAQKRLVLIDQDGSGPGGSNQMSMLVLLQSPQVQVLGITMVTGNAWRDEEAQHTLRMLELTGHTDIPVSLGAVYPLVRTQAETALEAPLVGAVDWLGAWGGGPTNLTGNGVPQRLPEGQSVIYQKTHGPYEVPPLAEGAPHIQPIEEDGVHFLIRQVHAHPHQVTIFACGPMTNIALAVRTDPHFAELTAGLYLMGGSLNPQTADPEFAETPRHEFNFWFDPEAASIVLRAPFPRIDVTTVDISLKATFTAEMVAELAKSPTPTAQYLAKFSEERYYMWDEITAASILDPAVISGEREVYMDVDLSRGPEYGNTLTWTDNFHPKTGVRKVHAQMDLDVPKFKRMFLELMTAPTAKP
jgi:inosine-uridine nucleoside N-ribohydrolase